MPRGRQVLLFEACPGFSTVTLVCDVEIVAGRLPHDELYRPCVIVWRAWPGSAVVASLGVPRSR